MNDIRTQLPECPLEYEVPHIPGTHTALVIEINAADIDWQEKMLPWTLASLINNTDIVMKGVHLYIACENKNDEDRIQTALEKFDLPKYDAPMNIEIAGPFILFGEHGYGYDSVCIWDINYWVFRGETSKGNPEIKLPLGHVLCHNYSWGVADYSIHPANVIQSKSAWIPTKHLRLTDPHTPESRQKLRNYFLDAGERARWLHDANTAVYGERYEKKGKNVAAYFFNESEPNWHLDASILQYQASDVVFEPAADWFKEWQHLGKDALIALYLLKTGQHAYNFNDSLMIESTENWNQIMDGTTTYLPSYPWMCNMKLATANGFRHAMKHLMGAQLAMRI